MTNKIDCKYYINNSREIIDEENGIIYTINGLCLLHKKNVNSCPDSCPYYDKS
jgi:hypothetical protein